MDDVESNFMNLEPQIRFSWRGVMFSHVPPLTPLHLGFVANTSCSPCSLWCYGWCGIKKNLPLKRLNLIKNHPIPYMKRRI